ncbi:MAG: hypothetical protein N3G19_01840 [Candidatus Pacearchaeota archaeon]|nr:hypothetical protein [Candidatus Pacearchaeota archaeon]
MYSIEIQNKYEKYKQYRKPSISYQNFLYKEVINRQRAFFYEIIKGYQEKQKIGGGKTYNFKLNSNTDAFYKT